MGKLGAGAEVLVTADRAVTVGCTGGAWGSVAGTFGVLGTTEDEAPMLGKVGSFGNSGHAALTVGCGVPVEPGIPRAEADIDGSMRRASKFPMAEFAARTDCNAFAEASFSFPEKSGGREAGPINDWGSLRWRFPSS